MGPAKSGFTDFSRLVKVIVVAFDRSAKISEHGDTKLALSESTETILAET